MFNVHNSIVNGVSWSHSGKLLITSSDDGSSAILVPGRAEPTLRFTHRKRNVSSVSATNNVNNKYSGAVSSASFFYLDKLVLLSNGNSVYVYTYQLDGIGSGRSDLQKLQNNSSYNLVKELSLSAERITCVASVNSVLSHLVLTAGSNRGLSIWDLGCGRIAREVSDLHSKPVLHVSLAAPTPYVSHPTCK
jgi:WD40 repeat protein